MNDFSKVNGRFVVASLELMQQEEEIDGMERVRDTVKRGSRYTHLENLIGRPLIFWQSVA